MTHVAHYLPEEEGEIHGDEEEDDEIIEQPYQSKDSFWQKIQWRKKIDQPDHSKNTNPQLECQMQAFPREQVDNKMSEQHGEISDLLNDRSCLSRVPPVVSVDICLYLGPDLGICWLGRIFLSIRKVGEDDGDSLSTVWAWGGSQG